MPPHSGLDLICRETHFSWARPRAGDWPADGGLLGLNPGLNAPSVRQQIVSASIPAPYSAQGVAPAPALPQGKTLALHKGVFTEPVKLLKFNPTKKSIF